MRLQQKADLLESQNRLMSREQEHYVEQIVDLKKELRGMESNSNLIVFSSKQSTVSPSEAETSTVQSDDDDVAEDPQVASQAQMQTRQTLPDDDESGTIQKSQNSNRAIVVEHVYKKVKGDLAVAQSNEMQPVFVNSNNLFTYDGTMTSGGTMPNAT